MKRTFTFLMVSLLAFVGVKAEVAADLVGKYFSVAEPATALQTDTWYLLKNQGRGAYISEESDGLKMKAVGNVPQFAEATANAGVLFKLASGENEGQYSIISGNGNYLTFGSSSSAVSASAVDYIIGSIAEGYWYMQDPTSNIVADGNAAGGTFVGWGTSVPAGTNGNNAYQFLEVALFDEAAMTTLNKAAGMAYDLQVASGLVTDASKFSSNAKEPSEGTFGALIDGEYTSYFHSAYSVSVDGAHYLQAEVNEPVKDFFFYFKKRSHNNNNRPTDITVLGSNDGQEFKEITTINTGFPTDAADLDYASAVINASEAYKHFRFVVNQTNSGTVFFTFSEFYLLPADKVEALAAAQALVAAGPAAENFDELAAEFETICNMIQADKVAKLHEAAVAEAEAVLASVAHASTPALGQYPTASYDTFKAAVEELKAEATQENVDAIKAALVAFEATKNLPLFTIDSQKDYALGQSIYENENGGLNFKTTDVADKSMLWAFDLNATEVGLTDKVVVRNAATGNLFWGASFISVIETEPAVEGDGVFMFKTEGTGAPVHAQETGSAIVRWSSADANCVGGASTWKFTFVGVSNPAAYDLSEVAAVFSEQAMAFAGLQNEAALSSLPKVQEMWAEGMGVVEPLFAAVEAGDLVLKADVEAAMEMMSGIQAVVAFYAADFSECLADAEEFLATLEEGSERYQAWDAAIAEAKVVNNVTTVKELEDKMAALEEAFANLPEDKDPNDYTDAIVNADLSTGDAWNTGGTKGISGGMVKVASESAFDFSQTITLPAGQYKMTAKAVYRYTGSEAEEFAAIEAGTKTRLVNLYAETATYKYEADVMNRYDGASDTDYAAGNGSVTVNGKFVPNSSAAVQAWFNADQYVNELVFNVQEEGQVKIGLTRTGSIAGDYTNIGAWTLTRLGDAEADPTPEPEPEPEPEEPGNDADYDLSEGTWSDATAYLVNADFSSFDGWTIEGLEKNSTSYRVMEFYSGWASQNKTAASAKQNVDLPAGIYRLSGSAWYRYSETWEEKYDANKSMGYLVAGEASAVVPTIASAGLDPLPSYDNAADAFYNKGLYGTSVEFTLDDDATVAIGYECAFEYAYSWFIVGGVKLEKKITLKDNFMEQAAEFSAFGQSSMALYSLGAVQEKWAEVMAVVEPLYGAVAEGQKVLKADVVAAMELMATTMAEIKPVTEFFDGKFTDTKWAMYDIQDNSTANSDEIRAAFDDAIAAALNVYAVTTVAELEAKVAEMEAARQAYVLNAVPAEGFAFDYTFKVANPDMENGNSNWEGGWGHAGSTYTNGDISISKFTEKWTPSNGGLGNTTVSQTIKNLPSGVYSVTATVNATRQNAADQKAAATGVYLFGNDSTVAVATYDGKPEIFTVEDIVVVTGELTIGIKCVNAEANWVGFDNVRLAYTGALPESVLLELKKEAFIERYGKFELLAEGLDYSWNAINNNYYFTVQEAAWAVKEGIAEVTDMETLDTHMAAMDEAEAALNEAYAAAAVYTTYKNLLWDASDNSMPASQEVADMKDAALENSNYAGYTLASTEAIEAATAELKAVYEAYVLNAYATNGYMFDVTFLVANAAVTSAEGWTNAEGRIINNTEYAGAPDKAAFDAGWWAGVIDIHQVLPTLPAGNYVLSAVARSASPESYLYAKSGETEVKTTLPQNGDQGGELGNGWANVSTDTINVVEGETLTIGVYINNPGANFAAVDNFKLYFGGLDSTPLYDLSEIREAFEAQAMEFMSFGQGSMALYQLAALKAQYNEVMMQVETLYSAIYNEEKVLKADVEDAMELMTTTKAAIEPVVAYYSETYSEIYYGADDLLQTLDPASEEYAALDAVLGQVWDLSEVTTVEELEAKAAIIEEGVAPFYDLTEVRDAFEAQAMDFMSFGQGSMALYQLSALHAQYNEVMMEVEALYSAIYNEEKVLKSDVVAAMDAMTTTKSAIEPVLAYYTESYSVVYYGADDLLQTLDPASEKYAILDAALGQVWDLSEVTTVAELEAKAAIINKAMIETGIDNIIVDEEVVIYDLSGRRVTEMKKGGIYIVNGKKVINK